MMSVETRELLAALRQMNQEIPRLALGLLDGSLSVAKQVAFAEVLEAAGSALRNHSREQRPVVVDGEARLVDPPASDPPATEDR